MAGAGKRRAQENRREGQKPPDAINPIMNPAQVGGFDGPTDASSSRGPNPFGPSLGYDPARGPMKELVITNTRVELPSAAYRPVSTDYSLFNHLSLYFGSMFPRAFPHHLFSRNRCH